MCCHAACVVHFNCKLASQHANPTELAEAASSSPKDCSSILCLSLVATAVDYGSLGGDTVYLNLGSPRSCCFQGHECNKIPTSIMAT